jgi:hypothetical protein
MHPTEKAVGFFCFNFIKLLPLKYFAINFFCSPILYLSLKMEDSFMKFDIRREDYSTYDLGFSTKPMENLMNTIASHRLSKLFSPNGISETAEIYIRKIGKKEFWLIGSGVWAQLNQKNENAKITFEPDIYRYEVNVQWNDFNPTEIIDQFADAFDRSEQVIADFACRFYDLCNLKKNREQYACDFDIEFDLTNLDAIRCNIENGAAMASTSFVCSLDELRTKDAQEVFDAISYAYTDEEL